MAKNVKTNKLHKSKNLHKLVKSKTVKSKTVKSKTVKSKTVKGKTVKAKTVKGIKMKKFLDRLTSSPSESILTFR